jgi:deoxyribonuclease V
VEIRELHPWDLSPNEAMTLQRELRRRLALRDVIHPDAVRLVAGVDNGYLRAAAETTACAAAISLHLPSLEVAETRLACLPVTFPYVPGLLAFREVPVFVAALRQLAQPPDVVLVDAHGYAHPRRLGEASHLGLLLERPTIGCAKSRLVGHYEEPPDEPGACRPLIDRGEVVGAVVRTKPGHSPLFVSPGHLVTIETAVEIVLRCCRTGQFLPEPTRLADQQVRAEMQRRRQLLG